ncbi:MAG: hypothetical protein B6D41_12230 [Chloroflexi bacterium UTCFX4]|nr:MAG: hypothetical protein B6D41_12230 [Chloroflexi bacterium UTCFX4]
MHPRYHGLICFYIPFKVILLFHRWASIQNCDSFRKSGFVALSRVAGGTFDTNAPQNSACGARRAFRVGSD